MTQQAVQAVLNCPSIGNFREPSSPGVDHNPFEKDLNIHTSRGYIEDGTQRTVHRGRYTEDGTQRTVHRGRYIEDGTQRTVHKGRYIEDGT